MKSLRLLFQLVPRGRIFLVAGLALLVLSTSSPFILDALEQPNRLTLAPIADTFVHGSKPAKAFGAATSLGVSGAPEKHAFLQFDLSALAGKRVTAAFLTVTVANKTNVDPLVRAVSDTSWSEETLTYETRPPMAEVVAVLPASGQRLGAQIRADVTEYVQAHAGSVIALGVAQAGRNGFRLVSKEGREGRPQLWVEFTTTGCAPDAACEGPEGTATEAGAGPSAPQTVGSLPLYLPLLGVNGESQAGPTELRAFPGAEGFGARETVGGRGGRIVYVTNLDDSGEGSLRAALEAAGPRTVLFQVAGTIDLENDIDIDDPYVTLAGQSAPGEGIQIKGGMIKIKTHDVIIRHVRVRPGDALNESEVADRDAISLTATQDDEVYNVILDHVSITWGPDIGGLAVLQNVHHVTIQNSIIGEGLHLSNHPEATLDQGGHALGLNIVQLDPDRYGEGHPRYITLHHNLLTTSDHRMPQVQGGEFIDIVNNVIYNWGSKAAHGNPRKVNLIGNMFVMGPETTRAVAWLPTTNALLRNLFPASVYEQGNMIVEPGTVRGEPFDVYASTRFAPYSMDSEQSAQAAYQRVLAEAGATLPVRGPVDQQILDNLVAREGRFRNGVGHATNPPVWPDLQSGPPAIDEDRDGMPDSWEMQQFGTTQRGSASDSSGDYDGDGYTDVEEFLNQTDPTTG